MPCDIVDLHIEHGVVLRFVAQSGDMTGDAGALNGRGFDLPEFKGCRVLKWITGLDVFAAAFWGSALAVCANTPAAAQALL